MNIHFCAISLWKSHALAVNSRRITPFGDKNEHDGILNLRDDLPNTKDVEGGPRMLSIDEVLTCTNGRKTHQHAHNVASTGRITLGTEESIESVILTTKFKY